MSEREVYCEKDIEVQYDGYSSEIITNLYNIYNSSIKTKYASTKKYLEYRTLKKYNTLFMEYRKLSDALSLYRNQLSKSYSTGCSIYYSIEIKKQMHEITSRMGTVYNALAELETSQVITELLKKAIEPNGNIRMDFLIFGESVHDNEVFLFFTERFTPFEKRLMGKSENT